MSDWDCRERNDLAFIFMGTIGNQKGEALSSLARVLR